MNPVLLIAYGNLELTKASVASALSQDIDVELFIINNGSTDHTREWLDDLVEFCPNVHVEHLETNTSPVKISNEWLPRILSNADYVLGIPNDVILPSNLYSELLKWPRGFVCATDNGQVMPEVREGKPISENTPMAVMLTRKWAYQAIIAHSGYFFDENFTHYASDCCLALRMAACGIRGIQIDTPFWHYGSATLKNADAFTRRKMELEADADRAYFERKYGFTVDSLEYGQRPSDLNFKAESMIGECAKIAQTPEKENA